MVPHIVQNIDQTGRDQFDNDNINASSYCSNSCKTILFRYKASPVTWKLLLSSTTSSNASMALIASSLPASLLFLLLIAH